MIKSSTVHVGNLPEDVRREEVEEVFGSIGPIKKCFLLKRERYGYVSFSLPEDADRAVSELSNHQLSGCQLTVALSDRRQKRRRLSAPPKGPIPPKGSAAVSATEPRVSAGRADRNVLKREEDNLPGVQPSPGGVFQQRVLPGQQANTGTVSRRRPRLIIRNVPFKVTEQQFAAHFTGVGPVAEARLLRKPDGRLVGCGFVEYDHMKHAATAIKELSGRPLLDRPIIIDWAVDKASYGARMSKPANPERDEEEDENEDGGAIDGTALHADEMECENSTHGADRDEKTELHDSSSEHAANFTGNTEEEEESDSSDDEETDESGVESEEEDNDEDSGTVEKKRRKMRHTDDPMNDAHHDPTPKNSSDTVAASTLFIKNLSFDTDNASLREFFARFGAVKYAVICIDSLTERPRGTGFVQFVRKEDADALLDKSRADGSADELTLDERVLEVLPALDREQLKQKQQEIEHDKRRAKDKRSLYLAREGLVRENTQAAEGVSKTDLSKRLGLEIWKVKMLKNANMFVSKTRLCIHNIPMSWEDQQLRKLFTSHSPSGAKITEARIMRDRRDLSRHPRGTSKEYGFVTFTEHEHALHVLRKLNNNPDVFSANRRPIVEFSVENRSVVEARQRRLVRSVARNPTAPASARASAGGLGPVNAQGPRHVGLQSDPAIRALPKPKKGGSRHAARAKPVSKPPSQGADGRKKRQERLGHKMDVVKEENTAAQMKSKPKALKNKNRSRKGKADFKEDASFAALVENYKNKLKTAQSSKPSVRWFE